MCKMYHPTWQDFLLPLTQHDLIDCIQCVMVFVCMHGYDDGGEVGWGVEVGVI